MSLLNEDFQVMPLTRMPMTRQPLTTLTQCWDFMATN